MFGSHRFMIKNVLLSKDNILASFLGFFFNFLAAIMEGTSYGVIFLAFSAITNQKITIPNFIPFTALLDGLSSRQLLLYSLSSALLLQSIRCCFLYISSLFTSHVTEKGLVYFLHQLNQQILKLSYTCFHKQKIGHMTDLATSLPLFFPQWMICFHSFVMNVFLIIIALSVLFLFSANLITAILAVFLAAGLIHRFLLKKLNKISTQVSEESHKKSSSTVQLLTGIRTIHLFSNQKFIVQRMEPEIQRLAYLHKKGSILNGTVQWMNELIIVFALCTSIIVGYFVLFEEIANSMSLLLGFMPIALRLAQRIAACAQILTQISFYKGKIDQLESFLSSKDKEIIDESGEDITELTNQISFNNLFFSYSEKSDNILKNCSFTIEKDSVFALVGESGAGKSTLLDLLLKLYVPSEGNIAIDGKNLALISAHSWRSLIGVVSQDPFIFHDSIEFNIRIGNPDASEEEIIQAAKLAGAHNFILNLEQQYKTVIGERGHRLSGGERQRIALARAVLRNPQILVLDEATSNLDSESELFIQNSLENLRATKTIIIVAHRLSTIAKADKIVVIDQGTVIESGKHEELKNAKGKYSIFWNIQHGSFQEQESSETASVL